MRLLEKKVAKSYADKEEGHAKKVREEVWKSGEEAGRREYPREVGDWVCKGAADGRTNHSSNRPHKWHN